MRDPNDKKEKAESLSREDLDRLMKAASSEETESGGGTSSPPDLVDQLLKDVSEEEVAPDAAEKDPVSESRDEAASFPGDPAGEDDNNLLSQEELDRLLEEDDEEEALPADEASAAEDQDPLQDPMEDKVGTDADEPFPEAGEETVSPPDPGPDSEADTSLISSEDIDRLLSGAGEDDTVLQEDMDDEVGLVSSEDIDRLLMENEEEGLGKEFDPEDEGLSDQEEIDRLLKGIEADGAGDEVDPDAEQTVIPQEDIDQLLEESIGEENLTDSGAGKVEGSADKVILEEADETEPVVDTELSKTGQDPRVKSKLLLVGVSLAGVMVMAFAGVFLYFQMRPEPAAAPETAESTTEQQVSAIPMPAPSADTTSLDMAGFVVFAPAGNEDVVFLKADVSIDFEDKASFDGIKKHEAYFRYLIYNDLKEALNLEDASSINEPLLIRKITRTLQKTLPDKAITGVVFSSLDIVPVGQVPMRSAAVPAESDDVTTQSAQPDRPEKVQPPDQPENPAS